MPIEIFILGTFLAGISNTFFGLLVYINNRHTVYGRVFLALSLSFSFWILSYSVWLIQSTAPEALFWSRMLNLGATFIPIFFLHWVLSFLGLNKEKKYILYFGYLLTVFFAAFSFSPLYISGVEQVGAFRYWPQAGVLYSIFLAVSFVGFFAYAIFLLLRRMGKEPVASTLRLQGKYILIGSIISIIGGSSNFPLMYGFPFYAFLTLLTIFHPFFWAYGAVMHRFFNMKVVATELLIFGIWIFLLVRTIFTENIQDQFIEGALLAFTVVLGVLLIHSVRKEVETRKQIEALADGLKKANERLRELDQQKSEFVSIASHQLRSPLTAIKGYASMLLEGAFAKIPDKNKEPVQKIYQSSQNLMNIVEDFLNITRIEQGRMKYEFEQVDIESLLLDIIEELKPTIKDAHLSASLKTDGGGNYNIRADRGKIRQVFLNLIDNSIKYTPKGEIKIHISRSDKDDTVVVSIADTGIGVSPELLKRGLFDKFNRGENSMQMHANGSGIGLYIAREIVKAHHGRIWAKPGKGGSGTVFYIELPIGKR